ncbi:hypothetical protein [Pseudomonas fulva]|uniref:hypothetical protein n=1 Tax=Pseudomonas fulva TaxID=47880 RepID=UPI000D9699BB|nr:hypothetical protein [Pseudomonas fulva]PYB93593.1 hypothetical protein DMX01_03435 [Pseudomonas fulva]PYC16418.1 hypothetical protein DMX00_05025 [Pseudomonas fulva]
MTELLTNWITDPRNWGALIVTAPIAVIALVVAIKNYKRKSGIAISGGFGIASSVRCEESYVSYIVLENLKDRAVTIYGIFLKVGHNFYIKLEDHDEAPLIMKPYETYHKKMGEIIFYTVNSNTIKMEKLLQDKKAKKRLVLSTSEGKYVVPKQVKRWSPIGEFFRNHLTGLIHIVRVTHNGECIGGNVDFIVDILKKDGATETIQLLKSDYQLKIFRSFDLTRECLESKDSLQLYLEKRLEEGLLSAGSTVKVYDFGERATTIKEHYEGDEIIAERWGGFYYHIFGPLYTRYSGFMMKKRNKRVQQKQRKHQRK